ncbi:MAG TPA: KUP/HAK/KT family potassium transporter, partial [Acidimicrobiales bacterium]
AVEGIEVATDALERLVVPLAVVILASLFLVQRRGTAGIGRVFGPVMLVWFVCLAALGLRQIVKQPEVLEALNPLYAVQFFAEYRWDGFWALGSIFLVVTGGEALYADMGHFGRRPIRLGWFSLVFPALTLNYLGQGALLLREPEAVENPFFHLGPSWAIWPMVVLATFATVIASQALITGAYSLTTQAMQMDYLPRLAVRHTSTTHMGQVYVPAVNWILAVACIGLVIGFRTSSRLAAAYGIAVTTTMAITTVLFMAVAHTRWRWSTRRTLLVGVPLLLIDVTFVAAQTLKIPHGGWFAIGIGVAQFTMMTTWRKGRSVVAAEIRRGETPLTAFVESLEHTEYRRVPGTAVFLFKDSGATPPALIVNLRHNKVLHEQVLLVSIQTADIPYVPQVERAQVTPVGPGIWQVVLTFGYYERPNVPAALAELDDEIKLDMTKVSYFLGRENVISTPRGSMNVWRERLFALQLRTAASAARFFDLPAERVFEVGTNIEI